MNIMPPDFFPANYNEFLRQYLYFPTDSHAHSTWAIVFSSSKLLLKEQGSMIDNFQSVMRFNCAPTKNYEQFVGSKTTHRLNEVSTRFQEGNEQTFTYETYTFYPVQFFVKDAQNVAENNYGEFYANFHIISNQFNALWQVFLYTSLKVRYSDFSTGLLGVFMAVTLSSKDEPPTIFGFETQEERLRSQQPHYYDVVDQLTNGVGFLKESQNEVRTRVVKRLAGKKKYDEKTQVHNYALEKKILIELHKKGLIRIHDFSV